MLSPNVFPTQLRRWLFCLATGLLLLTGSAQAQLQALAQLTSPKGYVGTPLELVIQVIGTEDTMVEGDPIFTVDGLDVGPPTSSGVIEINSLKRMLSPIRYQITPRRTGQFTIPAVELKANGTIIQSNALQLNVVEAPQAQTQPILQLKTPKTELWEGEESLMEIQFCLPQTCQIQELGIPSLARNRFAMKRFTRDGREFAQEINGGIYRVFSFQSTFYGMTPGDLTLGPASMKGQIFVGGRMSPLGMRNLEPQNYAIESSSVPIKVKPLPTQGRPEGFNGAVGQFTISVQVQPNRVNQGDPLTALIIVQGSGNYDTLEAPFMESKEGWRTYEPKVVQENRNANNGGQAANGAVVYSQIIEPQIIQKSVPPFVLHYFDPNTAQYVTARSAEVPIAVNPVKAATTTEAGQGNGTVGARDFGSTGLPLPNEQLAGFLGMLPELGSRQPLSGGNGITILGQPWLVHGVPLAILFGMLGYTYWKRQQAAQQQKQVQAAEVKPKDILRDLRQTAQAPSPSPQTFYSLATKFLELWETSHKKALPDDALARRVRLGRDFFCYSHAQTAESSLAPSEALEILTALEKHSF